jgi:hypothetical protein
LAFRQRRRLAATARVDILWVNDNGKASIWSTFLKAPAISERQ